MSLTEAMLLEDVRRRLFAPSTSPTPHAVGIELELIPVVRASRKRALAIRAGSDDSSTSDVLSRVAAREGWLEQPAGDDPSSWLLSDGGRISFEPGGQIEISTAPKPTASAVIAAARDVVLRLRQTMSAGGIDLLACGVDPYNDIEAVPLQLTRERYTRMTRYFDAIGPSGIRMMRQTAALQINVERGNDPLSRWRLLNALAPIVVGLFANSRLYAGNDTPWASYRSQLWRTLDPSRTGIVYDDADPAAKYLEFALGAGAMRARDDKPQSFREWMIDPAVDRDDWSFHLSTLFPEVRAKEFFELRSADTIEPEFLAAPVVFVTSLVYDDIAAREAAALLGPPSTELLERAGLNALADPAIHAMTSDLVDCALRGAGRLGADYIAPSDIDDASLYFARALASHDIGAMKAETTQPRRT